LRRRIREDLPAPLPDQDGNGRSAALDYALNDGPQMRCLDGTDRQLADLGEHVLLQERLHLVRVVVAPLQVAGHQRAGDRLEGVFVPLDLVGDLHPLLQGQIATFANHVGSPFALLPSRFERDLGEGADRVDRRHVPQAVPVPPELASVGLNAQEQAPAVPERVRLGLRLSGFELANGEELEGHVYNAFRCVRYSHRYTHSPWLGLACRRPHQTLNPCESTTYATSLDVQSPRRTTFVVIDHQKFRHS